MSIRDLCYKIDITEQGLHQMIRNKSMKVEILERISAVLGKPVSYWFSDEPSNEFTSTNNVVNKVAEIGRNVTPKITYQKIDSLTKDLNEMLKEIISK
jgi:transcriptional regulator with XRE-family HTH domain